MVFFDPWVHAALDKTPVVFARPCVRAEIADELSYPARAEAKVNAAILAETEGVVTRIKTPLGHAVKRSQSLMVLQQTDPIYQFAPAPVKSAVTGVVSSMEVTEGSRVTKGQRLATVTDPKSLRVSVEIPAQDLSVMQPGLKAQLSLPGVSEMIPVTLQGISPHVDSATGTASAEFEPSVRDLVRLRPGMVGKVHLKVNARQAFSVPEDALVYRKQETLLRIVEEGKTKSVPVVLGRRFRGRVEILSGLADNMNVIERTSGFVAEGEAVKVQAEEEGSGS